jgi:tRNA(Ile)-lysidine synthase
MILNIVRGTSPRGLAPMQHQPDLLRPLINKRKQELINYAKENKLKWREDSTNDDESYMRNYIRANIMPNLETARSKLLDINERIDRIYLDIDMRISGILYGKRTIYRPKFVYYPYSVQKEIIRAWLLKAGVKELDKQMIERITNAVKTLPIEKKMDVDKDLWLKSDKQNVYLTSKK